MKLSRMCQAICWLLLPSLGPFLYAMEEVEKLPERRSHEDYDTYLNRVADTVQKLSPEQIAAHASVSKGSILTLLALPYSEATFKKMIPQERLKHALKPPLSIPENLFNEEGYEEKIILSFLPQLKGQKLLLEGNKAEETLDTLMHQVQQKIDISTACKDQLLDVQSMVRASLGLMITPSTLKNISSSAAALSDLLQKLKTLKKRIHISYHFWSEGSVVYDTYPLAQEQIYINELIKIALKNPPRQKAALEKIVHTTSLSSLQKTEKIKLLFSSSAFDPGMHSAEIIDKSLQFFCTNLQTLGDVMRIYRLHGDLLKDHDTDEGPFFDALFASTMTLNDPLDKVAFYSVIHREHILEGDETSAFFKEKVKQHWDGFLRAQNVRTYIEGSM